MHVVHVCLCSCVRAHVCLCLCLALFASTPTLCMPSFVCTRTGLCTCLHPLVGFFHIMADITYHHLWYSHLQFLWCTWSETNGMDLDGIDANWWCSRPFKTVWNFTMTEINLSRLDTDRFLDWIGLILNILCLWFHIIGLVYGIDSREDRSNCSIRSNNLN